MLDKLLLNNELLANKKKVLKGKTVTINKLVRKIKKLKSLTEKKPEDNKIKKKLLRNTEILGFLKQSKPVDILKSSLVNDKDLNKIIVNGRSLPEEIAEALLSSTKQIVNLVQQLKDKFCLDDKTNPGWRDKIKELSKKQQKQLRTERKQEIRQQRKTRHELSLKRNEWLDANVPETSTENGNEMDIQNDNIEINDNKIVVKTSDKQKKTKMKKDVKKTTSKFKKELSPKLIKKIDDQEDLSSEEKEENSEVENPKVEYPGIEEEPSSDEPEEEEPKEDEPEEEGPEEEEESEEEVEVIKSVDPFFLTETGDNYLSTAVVERIQPLGPNDGLIRKERRANKPGGIKRNRIKAFDKKNNWINKNNTNEKMHPSWVAKQSQKGISNFSGKKTLFDDSSNNIEIINKTKSQNGNNIEKKLHPSWEAKQKQKGIKNFTGKKISFDANTEISNNHTESRKIKSNLEKNNEKLHPSWAAKQNLKATISEFKGKKIKFDE